MTGLCPICDSALGTVTQTVIWNDGKPYCRFTCPNCDMPVVIDAKGDVVSAAVMDGIRR